MTGYLLDTNVVSEFIRVQTNPIVAEWVSSKEESSLYISVITLGELWKGFSILPESKRRSKLEIWFHNELIPWFHGRILPITDPISIRWGVFDGMRQLQGSPLGTADGLIAATAFEHGLTVATRNTKDFGGLGLTILNPWDF